MTPAERTAAVYAKLHKDRELHIEQARRARDMQAVLYRKSQTIQLLLNRYFDIFYARLSDKS